MTAAPHPRPARRLRRRRVLLVLLSLIGAGLLAGLTASTLAARRAHQQRLLAPLAAAAETGRAMAAPWWELPPADRAVIAAALLRQAELTWEASLEDAWLVELLAANLAGSRLIEVRRRAARALGDMADHTPHGAPARPLPAGLVRALEVLDSAGERDPDDGVRAACAAAALKLRALARGYGDNGSSVPSERNR